LKGQKGVTLSRSEAEYVATVEAVKEICSIYFLFNVMKNDVNLPILVRFDNIDVIFMAKNLSSGVITHHIDTKYHFDHEHVKGRLCYRLR
jgi:hypothetical protein